MSGRYLVVSAPAGWPEMLPFPGFLNADKVAVGVGGVLEVELSPEDERANIGSGLLKRARWWQGRLTRRHVEGGHL